MRYQQTGHGFSSLTSDWNPKLSIRLLEPEREETNAVLGGSIMAAVAVAESFLTLCFVVLKPGFSKDRGESGLRHVSPHSSPLCARWDSFKFWGLFLLPTSLLTGWLPHSLPLRFIHPNPTSSVLRAAQVLLSSIPASVLAKGISWHKRALAVSWLYICFSHFDHRSVGDRSCCSTKCPTSSRPPLCLEKKRWACGEKISPEMIHR